MNISSIGLSVRVCRSDLDRDVWYTYASASDGFEAGLDLIDFTNPGRLRAVQRYAAQRYTDTKQARWKRIDADTYEMEQIPMNIGDE